MDVHLYFLGLWAWIELAIFFFYVYTVVFWERGTSKSKKIDISQFNFLSNKFSPLLTNSLYILVCLLLGLQYSIKKKEAVQDLSSSIWSMNTKLDMRVSPSFLPDFNSICTSYITSVTEVGFCLSWMMWHRREIQVSGNATLAQDWLPS
jgi:hypothetical protein